MKNRELTFRFWHNNTSRFYYMHLTELVGLKRGIAIPKDSIIHQYTSLKDKNGKEIYEGDIVKTALAHMFRSGIHEVKYIDNRFVPDDICDDDCEVIGNIFENPELLK